MNNTSYLFAINSGNLSVQSEGRLRYDLQDNCYLTFWVDQDPKRNCFFLFVGVGYDGLDEIVWDFLRDKVNRNYGVVFEQPWLPPVIKSNSTILSGAGLPHKINSLKPGLQKILEKTTKECVIDYLFKLDLSKLFSIIKNKESRYGWALNPVGSYIYYICVMQLITRRNVFVDTHELPAERIDLLKNNIKITYNWDIVDLEDRIDSFDFFSRPIFLD